MVRIWARLRRWIRSGRQQKNAQQAARAQSEPNMAEGLIALTENDSLNFQRALAPSTVIAQNEDSLRVVQAQRSLSMPVHCNTDSILLAWPEYQLARQKRQNLDEAVPRELQQSKVSCDLHDLTLSAQAGRRPYCEDVADRNISSSESLYLAGHQDQSKCQPQHTCARRKARKAGKPPCSYITNTNTFNGDRAFQAQVHCAQGNRFSADGAAPKRSQSMHASIKSAVATEERRHSLPHKPNIFDLRNAVEAEQVGARIVSLQRHRSDSGASRRSSLTRARLNARLPLRPCSASPTDQGYKGGIDKRQQQPQRHDEVGTGQVQPNEPSSNHFGITTDTTVYERWAPAVTHETITTNTHEIREEHVRRETHNYHVEHMVQPVVDYEILPPRHFIREGDEIREIDEEDIPAGAPSADWYTSEVASQLDSLSLEDVPWDRTSVPSSKYAWTSQERF